MMPHVAQRGAPAASAVVFVSLAIVFGFAMILSRGHRLREYAHREAVALSAAAVPCRGALRTRDIAPTSESSGAGVLFVLASGDLVWRELGGTLRWSLPTRDLGGARIEQTVRRITYPMLVLDATSGERFEFYLQKPRGLMWRYGMTMREARETLSVIRRVGT